MAQKTEKPFSGRVLERLHGTAVNKGHRKQKIILDAFAKCLFEKGLADTSYAAVGAIAQMEPPHIGYYFNTWEKMLEACFKYVIATAQEVTLEKVAAAPNPSACLKAICEAPFLHLNLFPDHVAVLSAFQMECARKPKYRALHRKIREQGQGRIVSLLGMLYPGVHQPAEAEALAVAVQSLIVGYCSEWACGRGSDSSKQAMAKTWAAVQLLLKSSRGDIG